ncbi:unnamed protein product [Amaranthus hypochondriacus]
MSTIVYQELQFLESKTLSLKLNNPTKNNTTFSSFNELNSTHSHSSNYSRNCSWSEIQKLSTKKDDQKEESYIHPLAKNSSSFKLSEKSLEMCTESLGNETGCDSTIDDTFFFSLSPPLLESSKVEDQSMRSTHLEDLHKNKKKKMKLALFTHGDFPPPLTTMSGSNQIKLRTHKEDGRLVIQAFDSTPIVASCMKAQRSNGRLKLSLVSDYYDDIRVINDYCSSNNTQEGEQDCRHHNQYIQLVEQEKNYNGEYCSYSSTHQYIPLIEQENNSQTKDEYEENNYSSSTQEGDEDCCRNNQYIQLVEQENNSQIKDDYEENNYNGDYCSSSSTLEKEENYCRYNQYIPLVEQENNIQTKDDYLENNYNGDIKGITLELGVKLGLEKIQRTGRCKEGSQAGNKRLINYKPFWVAT